jgi:hypothetical protein
MTCCFPGHQVGYIKIRLTIAAHYAGYRKYLYASLLWADMQRRNIVRQAGAGY